MLIIDHELGLLEKLREHIENFALSEKGDKYLFAAYADGHFKVTEYVCADGSE